ncbi:MAG: hypothetical protein ACOX2F_12230 [bacterium]
MKISFIKIFLVSVLILSGFSCVEQDATDDDNSSSAKCKSSQDCQVGYECDAETGTCQKAGGLPGDNDGNQNGNGNGNGNETGDCSGHGTLSQDGECVCMEGYAGSNCNSCANGYDGYPDCRPEGSKCIGVDCNGHGVCLESIGGCSCYTGYDGEFCDRCELGYEGYPDCMLKLCEPGSASCKGSTIVECNELGTDFVEKATCEGEGISCHKGKCLDECGIAAEDKSYVGCEYWGAFLQQLDESGDPTYALVVANPNNTDVTVEIFTTGNVLKTSGTVPARGLHAFELGKERRILSAGISDLGYKLVASRPVTVTQMNPFGNILIYSNDATILLPIGALAGEYYAMSWPGWNSIPGFISVVAVEEGTTSVTVTYNGSSSKGTGINAELPGAVVTYNLNQYQVLNLNSANNGGQNSYGGDLTGSFIKSDRKLAVFGGHTCTRIPANKTACDHLEHQMFPLQSWGKNFVAARTKPRKSELDYFRILASENDTVISIEGGYAGNVTLQAGWFHDFSTDADFKVASSKPIMVGQFLASQDAGAGTGDPAMMLIAPDEQLRKDYIFLVPPNYDYNRITVIAQQNTEITVNETSYSSNNFVPIPGTSFLREWIDMPAGAHTLTANMPVGLYVYGFSRYVSYAYTAGLDLTAINIKQ